jgi:hypothetical protein
MCRADRKIRPVFFITQQELPCDGDNNSLSQRERLVREMIDPKESLPRKIPALNFLHATIPNPPFAHQDCKLI